MGFVATEIEMATTIAFRPLIGLQVWLHSRSRGNTWAQNMAPRVAATEPEGLYLHWADLKDEETGDAVIRSPVFANWPMQLDPYDLVRLRQPPCTLGHLRQLDTMTKAIKPKPVAAAPADEKPWWED